MQYPKTTNDIVCLDFKKKGKYVRSANKCVKYVHLFSKNTFNKGRISFIAHTNLTAMVNNSILAITVFASLLYY